VSSPASRAAVNAIGRTVSWCSTAGEVAVEVELTLKRRARIEQIMAELVARYGSVTYFAAAAPQRTLTQLAAEVGRGRVQVLELPKEES
jgi:hypothetical protein